MKKIASFIVKYRVAILVVFTVLALAGAVLMNFVHINYDMTSYMPDDSISKKGLSLMTEEFGESSYINLMFKNLPEEEKTEIPDRLLEIPYVDSVQYEPDSSDYNRNENTLYIVNLSADSFSEEAADALDTIQARYAGYDAYTSGPVCDVEYIGVGMEVILIAFALLLIILIIMCKSWMEPVLFIITIAIAVFINEGSNILFANISTMTKSIAALLQLVLSMDYSIMLLDRYRQERQTQPDKYEAMKSSLAGSFSAIAGSSVTTIVGLLCLVFMSFTIGRDLGLVLAKGVALSLLSVLFVLPSLVLMFDGAIIKSRKKALTVKMDKVAVLGHKLRYAILPIFLIFLVGGFLVKDLVLIEYSLSSRNPGKPVIEEVFPANNAIILLYDNADEEKASALISELENRAGVTDVSAYANTLGKKLTAGELAGQMDMDESLLQMLYYDYFNTGNGKLTLETFAAFLQNDVAENAQFAEYIDPAMLENLKQMAVFTSRAELTKARGAADMAGVLGMKKADVEQLYLFYQIQAGTDSEVKLTLTEFVAFIQNDVAQNPQFAGYLDADSLEQLEMLAVFTDKAYITRQMRAAELGGLLGMDPTMVEQLFTLHYALQGTASPGTMAPYDFICFVLDDLLTDPSLAAMIDPQMLNESALAQLTALRALMEASLSNTAFTTAEMAGVTGMEESALNTLYLYYQSLHGSTTGWRLSLQTMINFIQTDVLNNPDYADLIDADARGRMAAVQTVMNAVLSETEFTAQELAELIVPLAGDLDANQIELMYLYYFSSQDGDPDQALSLYDFLSFVVNNVMEDARFAEFFDPVAREELTDAHRQIEDGKEQLTGATYSRIIINTTYGLESDEAYALIAELQAKIDGDFSDGYLIGDSPINYEMKQDFQRELNFITILTVVSVFLVVAVTFRSLAVPAILVVLIQCAVYMTTATGYLQGVGTYYLALIIVQAILMGATIDYGILFTEYYREHRKTQPVRQALIHSYKGSITTILTSSSILCVITLIVGLVSSDPTTSQVCLTVAKGTFFAALLVIFVLPSLLAVFDRLVCGKNRFIESVPESDKAE